MCSLLQKSSVVSIIRNEFDYICNILKSKQSDWLKNFIDFNTDKRNSATSSFEKGFFKLMIDSVYGKAMEI